MMVARGKILLVEDYGPLLKAVGDILEMEGFSVFFAADGAAGLRAVEEVHPDLIVTDILMPEMDGYALYEAVRARPDWARIPFVFLTCKADEKDLQKAEALGVDGYITKPFEPGELVGIIRAKLASA
jgi:CheY-like chemotaxis protein